MCMGCNKKSCGGPGNGCKSGTISMNGREFKGSDAQLLHLILEELNQGFDALYEFMEELEEKIDEIDKKLG